MEPSRPSQKNVLLFDRDSEDKKQNKKQEISKGHAILHFLIFALRCLTHWKGVDQVPAELLCEEVGDSTAEHDLRELG